MRVALVSDVHLTGLTGHTQDAFVRWLDGLDVERLYLLGDVFHHWWGFPGAVATGYVPTCAALLRMRQRGVRLSVVPGNHDFALGPFFREVLGAEIRDAHTVVWGGVRYHLAHGDEADRSWGYRLTRRVLRGPAMALGMRALGPERGDRVLQRLAGDRRPGRQAERSLLDAQARWATDALARGADVVVLGHTHAPGITALPGGQLIRLGDWDRGPLWLLVEDGAPTLYLPGD